MTASQQRYLPALRFRALTRFYDHVLRLALREQRFKGLLVQQARLESGHRVLDLGCGTGTLTLLLKQAAPEASLIGLDADPEALGIARAKAAAAGLAIEFRQSLASEAPIEAGSLDRVVSSLFFHHLMPEEKSRTLSRVRELLRPGGELHVADWGPPHGVGMRLAFLPVQLLDGFANTAEHVRGALVRRMREAGFAEVAETGRQRTLLGTLVLYRARRSAGARGD